MLTTQWREEDEEEAAREQRQRDRERQLQDQDKDDEDEGGHSLEQTGQQALLSLKSSELDEDEGFSDWSQKPEPRQQFWVNEGTAEGPEPSQSESPEEEQTEESSHQAKVQLEESDLSYRESNSEDAVGGSGEAEELISQRARTPSPLASEDTLELSSPPLSPTTKLADRTESLNRSIKKSNSVKKSQPTLPISTIDERLQQYTQATESAGRTPKLSRQPSIELPSMAVASTKTRWETGEVQSASKTPSCQDIVAGDMSKKSLWEQKGGSKISSTIKSRVPEANLASSLEPPTCCCPVEILGLGIQLQNGVEGTPARCHSQP
ncbi:Lymphocyte-specific protein 1 [Apodemus speciosus]|uniref:Lymphocyte-specific protein 1 n=1 Tax=Apodemus speciosus TaxID=105296 RepID=A0ABQ0F0V8_APOSI